MSPAPSAPDQRWAQRAPGMALESPQSSQDHGTGPEVGAPLPALLSPSVAVCVALSWAWAWAGWLAPARTALGQPLECPRDGQSTSCLLRRCGVTGRRPGGQASPRWPQLLTTGPGAGGKLGNRELRGWEHRRSSKKGLVGAASEQPGEGPSSWERMEAAKKAGRSG